MDKYDKAIEYLEENPDEIIPAWVSTSSHFAGCLFQLAWRDYINFSVDDDKIKGCLSAIRMCNKFVAQTDKLTNEIAGDERIPALPRNIKIKHLPVFAEWQRRLDTELIPI